MYVPSCQPTNLTRGNAEAVLSEQLMMMVVRDHHPASVYGRGTRKMPPANAGSVPSRSLRISLLNLSVSIFWVIYR